MLSWRKKTNPAAAEQDIRDNRLLHPVSAPDIEPATEEDISGINLDLAHDLAPTENEIIEEMSPLTIDPDMPDADQSPSDSLLFPVLASPATEAEEPDDPSATGGWLSRLTLGLTKSSMKITQGLGHLVSHKKLDRSALNQLEEILIAADVGPATTQKIIAHLAEKYVNRDITDHDLRKMLVAEIATILAPCARPLVIKRPAQGPFMMLICGVNGVGKTSTIGKMAKIMHDQKHHSVMLVAGDTFRAAAVEQLQIWGTRAHAPVLARDIGADSAALAYESYTQAKRDGVEVVMIDTAGRLHNKAHLMAELEKIVRVLKKHGAALPHEVILVLDGTTGQNAFAQVETFKEMVHVTGLIVTKLDGSARGGVVVGLADRFGLPIYAVGVGEDVDDLHPFTARGYAEALVGV